MLTNAEIQQIEHGLFDIAEVGVDMTVPFATQKLRGASVAWINERWFLDRGIDVTDTDVRGRLDQWLIDEHAYIVPREDLAPSQVAPSTKTFWADLYGTSEMATHGGSGRVGITGRLQVKGLGRTPLVGANVDWLHSHGCLWLEEALREAVYAEVTANEFPHGAVPVLAVIDTGVRIQLENGNPSEPRALSIRPVVVRPAYLERAVLFQPPGLEHEARLRDVRRVRQMARYVEQPAGNAEQVTPQARFAETFARLARQIAFSRAHRLFPGNYSSSNVSMDGELLDFGSFRALPNWCRYISMNEIEGFGNEAPEINASIHAISFYFNKYKTAAADHLNPEALGQEFERELEQACAREFLSLFHLDDIGDDGLKQSVLATLFAYYAVQQKFDVRFQNSIKQKLDWFTDVWTAGPEQADAFAIERKVLADVNAAVRSSGLADQDKAPLYRRMELAAARLLPVRRELVRGTLAAMLHGVIRQRDDAAEAASTDVIATAVNAVISRSRRHWPRLPRHLLVLAQFCTPRCAVLYCLDPRNSRYFLWLEGASMAGRVWYVDRWLPQSAVEPYRHACDHPRWCGLFPADAVAPSATVAELDLRLPDGATWFETVGHGA